jgi:serine/threonine protein kinase
VSDVKAAGTDEDSAKATRALHGVTKDLPVNVKAPDKPEGGAVVEGTATLRRRDWGAGAEPQSSHVAEDIEVLVRLKIALRADDRAGVNVSKAEYTRPQRMSSPPPVASAEDLLGTKLGPYLLQDLLGEGAMGAVYLGLDEGTGARVAVKMMGEVALTNEAQRDVLVERFRREIETTQALDHPNIVRVLATGHVTSDLPYVVLEYLEGLDLRDLLDAEESLAPVKVARIGRQVAAALEAAHQHGIVHRDLKPENVFIVSRPGDPEVVKVVDFGIARMIGGDDDDERLTAAGTAIGTPRYMAPEQVHDTQLSGQTDLYALGIILFEMLVGHVPFEGESELETALMQVREPAPEVEVPGLAAAQLERWRALIGGLLDKVPAKRPNGAATVAAVLAKLEVAAARTAVETAGQPTEILRVPIPHALPRPVMERTSRTVSVHTTARVEASLARRQAAQTNEAVATAASGEAATARRQAAPTRDAVAAAPAGEAAIARRQEARTSDDALETKVIDTTRAVTSRGTDVRAARPARGVLSWVWVVAGVVGLALIVIALVAGG